MSPNNGESTFSFGDPEEDLESLLRMAEAAEVSEVADQSGYDDVFQQRPANPYTQPQVQASPKSPSRRDEARSPSSPPQNIPVPAEPVAPQQVRQTVSPASPFRTAATPVPSPVSAQSPARQMEQEEVFVPAETVQTPRPVRQTQANVKAQGFIADADFARKIIASVDAWRELSKDEKSFAAQFIGLSNEDIDNEAEAAVKVISVDQIVFATLSSLKEAKEASPVDRVILILKLERKILQSLASIVAAFSGTPIDSHLDKFDYAKALVNDIENLSNEPIELVVSTEGLLGAYKKV